jgi:hypothetical protein
MREEAWLRGLLAGTITMGAVAWKGKVVVPELAETCEAVARLREQVVAAWAEIAARSEAAVTEEQRANAASTWERHCRDLEEQRVAQATRAALEEAVRAAPEAKEGEKLPAGTPPFAAVRVDLRQLVKSAAATPEQVGVSRCAFVRSVEQGKAAIMCRIVQSEVTVDGKALGHFWYSGYYDESTIAYAISSRAVCEDPSAKPSERDGQSSLPRS